VSLNRVLPNHREQRQEAAGPFVPLDDWLDDYMAEHDWLIMRLRHVDKMLVKYGRLKQESLPRRVR